MNWEKNFSIINIIAWTTLIILGIVFLLENFWIINIDIMKLWPLAIIVWWMFIVLKKK